AAGGRAGKALAPEALHVAVKAPDAHPGDDAAASWNDYVDPHAVVEMVVGHRGAERDQPALAGGVGSHVRLAPSSTGTDVDDGPAALSFHMGQRCATRQVHAFQVDSKDLVEQSLVRVQ